MKSVVPTFTTSGFVSDINIMLVKIYEYFITSQKSQSSSFYTDIISLPYILQVNGNDFDNITSECISSLKKVCSEYWSNVTVDASISKIDNNGNESNNLFINIEVTEDGKTYYLDKSITIKESKVVGMDNALDYLRS